ncbi:MAG: hypothetical protein EHM64_00990 [Ignavibacteriae bacterium]|nr:MAG: hypothetical protein EHM64_00990 [Ignavibacteriota bacterium]
MSWLFGVIKSGQKNFNTNEYEKLYPGTLYKLTTQNLHIALGGIEETCFYEVLTEAQDVGWAVLGLGIRVSDSNARILSKKDWNIIFSSGIIQTDTLDGHFVALRWNKDELELWTDQLGLRTVYYGTCDAGICFSTRLDWVAKTTKKHDINRASLGGRWLLFNQLSYDSCVNGIERLGPSSRVVIKNGKVLKHESHPWSSEFGNQNEVQAISILESLVHAAAANGHTVSLGLSGGLDSRTLLSILLDTQNINFDVHTFGEPLDPDVRISEDLSRGYSLKRHYLNKPIPNSDELIALVNSFVAQNILVEPVSSILKLRYYSQQHNNGHLIIDGGFGEIARRQYLNRIVRLGRSALFRRDVPSLFKLMRTTRADIFNPEYSKELVSAARQSLDTTLHTMPTANEIGVENFVDLLSIRTRVPNFGEPEQTRSDSSIMNFMPMAQASFLKAVLKTDLKWRRNGRLYRDIIRTKKSCLMNYPLVKSGTTYPFHLASSTAWMVTKVKNQISKPYADTLPDRFLLQLKEFVLDLAHSNEVRNWSGYNQDKILYSVDSYYKGDSHLRSTVNWWLTFELWKRSISN